MFSSGNLKSSLFFCALVLGFSSIDSVAEQSAERSPFFTGADLSYVNEMEDCGGTYFDHGEKKDPFAIFASYGTDIVRVRLWHNASWTKYSNLEDVAKTIKRAKAHNMRVLLDFHYSDTWTDPERQEIPDAWKNISTTKELAQSLYEYTQTTLQYLESQNLLPNMVQVGNEINIEIMQPKGQSTGEHLNWQRNATLINSGIKAVRDFSNSAHKKIAIVLHIAQPENALWWFSEAAKQGITDFDVMGLSYYPQWSTYKITATKDNPAISDAVKQLISTHRKALMIVETGYPWTLQNFDKAGNVMNKEAVLAQYPATPHGQLNYLLDLSKSIRDAGALGIIYWEPAWISTKCSTQWAQGSHWENGAFFDAARRNSTLPAFQFFREAKK